MPDAIVSRRGGIDVGRLPSLPVVLLDLIQAVQRPDVDLDTLSAIIRKDAGLCARVLAVAGSARYAQFNAVRDIHRALLALGLDAIRSIAVTAAVQQFFTRVCPEAGPWMGHFWRCSLHSAHAARALARLVRLECAEEAYLVGLLHRVGQLVLLRSAPRDYARLLDEDLTPGELESREQALFGVSAPQLGARLAKQWAPQGPTVDAIRYQRRPATDLHGTATLIPIINLAHKLGEADGLDAHLLAEAHSLFGLAQEVLEELQDGVDEAVDATARKLGIRLGERRRAAAPDGAEDEATMLELARRVREFALLDGVGRGLPQGGELDDLLQALLQGAGILFGLDRVLCVLADEDTDALVVRAASWAGAVGLQALSLPRNAPALLVNRALHERQTLMLRADDAPLAVLDEQLLRLFERPVLFAVPMLDAAASPGSLLAGVDADAAEHLVTQGELLRSYASLCAERLRASRAAAERTATAVAAAQSARELTVRSAVHEAGNPLSVMRNYLEVLGRHLEGDLATHEHLRTLSEEVQRVGDILLRLRDPATTPAAGAGVDLNATIRALVEVLRVAHFQVRRVSVHLDLDESIEPLACAPGKLRQVLTNLFRNAAEAMAGGGDLHVMTRNGVNVDGRQFIELVVADSGPGIPVSVMDDLFTPVKSTKGQGHAGLGLAIVKSIVAELGGSIQCRNQPSSGAEFTILLPRRRAAR